MRPSLRFLHILGLVLFLGSLPTHIILGMAEPGGAIPAQGVLFARSMLRILTLVATAPGLILLAVTGVMGVRNSRWAGAGRWVVVHAVLGGAVAALGLLVLTPTVMMLAEQAKIMADGTDSALWARLAVVEDVAGAFNLIVALLAVALVSFRPALRFGMRGEKQ